ncbi:hypothetical protein D3C78_1922520 [compost metagenome]
MQQGLRCQLHGAVAGDERVAIERVLVSGSFACIEQVGGRDIEILAEAVADGFPQ